MVRGGTLNDDEDSHLHFMYSQSNEHVGNKDRWRKFWTIQSQEGSSTNMDVVRAPSSRDDDFDEAILISNDPLLEGLRTTVEDDDHYSEYESLTHLHCPQPIKPTDVVVTIQASTISAVQRTSSKEKYSRVSFNMSSGHAIVGVVRDIGSSVRRYGFNVGDRVASIVKSTSKNPRYVTLPVKRLVKVPCGLDSSMAASASYTYTVAFQSLAHGARRLERFSSKVNQGKQILVIEGASLIGQAVIELSILSGAVVFATGSAANHQYISSLGATPLDNDINKWLPMLRGKMDVVIDTFTSQIFQYEAVEKSLKKNGRLVCIGTPMRMKNFKHGSSGFSDLCDQIRAQTSLIFLSQEGATYYDLFCNIDNYSKRLMKDLEYVLSLLACQFISPRIKKYVTIDEVAYGLVPIEPGVAGTIICEPWRKKGPPR